MTASVQALRRWGVWALVVGVAAAALVIGASRPAPASLAARTRALASEVRCPVCQGESAEQSQVPAAVQIRTQIQSELAAGVAPAKVLDDLERAYGATILEKPPAQGIGLVVWVLPVVIALAALTGLGLAFRRWGRRPGPAGTPVGASPSSSPEDAAVVAEALAVAARRSP